MIPKQDIKKYYEENYEKKNHKRGRGINVPERLFRDYHKLCVGKGVSMSKEIRLFMTGEIMDNDI